MARLLLISDSPWTPPITMRFLEAVGHYVLVAASDGVAVLSFDLFGRGVAAVVVDVTLPESVGIAAMETIRRSRPDVPFLFMSDGDAMLPETIRGDARAALLTKPVLTDDLVATLDRLLSAPWSDDLNRRIGCD